MQVPKMKTIVARTRKTDKIDLQFLGLKIIKNNYNYTRTGTQYNKYRYMYRTLLTAFYNLHSKCWL